LNITVIQQNSSNVYLIWQGEWKWKKRNPL
jgi:hypothetical protein